MSEERPDVPEKLNACINCKQELQFGFEFCPACGQKVEEKLSLRLLFNNTISNYFSVDARFFRSFLPLLFKPGFLPLQFVSGKRKSYLHPAQFYLFISVLFFFIFSLRTREQTRIFDDRMARGIEQTVINDSIASEPLRKGIDSLLHEDVMENLPSKVSENIDSLASDSVKPYTVSFDFDELLLDSLIKAGATREEKLKAMGMSDDPGWFEQMMYSQVLKIYEKRGGGILKSLYDTIPVTLFLVLPLFALLLKLLFYRKGKYANHLVFAFYYFTFVFCVYAIYLIPSFFVELPRGLNGLHYWIFFLYLVLALMKFYSGKFWRMLGKALVLALAFAVIVLPLSFFLMMMYTVMTY